MKKGKINTRSLSSVEDAPGLIHIETLFLILGDKGWEMGSLTPAAPLEKSGPTLVSCRRYGKIAKKPKGG